MIDTKYNSKKLYISVLHYFITPKKWTIIFDNISELLFGRNRLNLLCSKIFLFKKNSQCETDL